MAIVEGRLLSEEGALAILAELEMHNSELWELIDWEIQSGGEEFLLVMRVPPAEAIDEAAISRILDIAELVLTANTPARIPVLKDRTSWLLAIRTGHRNSEWVAATMGGESEGPPAMRVTRWDS